MNLSRPLEVVTPTLDADVLAALALADQAFTPGDLSRLIGKHSISGIRKVLIRLAAQGIVLQERSGPAFTYRLNRQHLGAAPIIALATMKAQFLQRLRAE